MLHVLVRLALGEALVGPPDEDLMTGHLCLVAGHGLHEGPLARLQLLAVAAQIQVRLGRQLIPPCDLRQIGRASCRERV